LDILEYWGILEDMRLDYGYQIVIYDKVIEITDFGDDIDILDFKTDLKNITNFCFSKVFETPL
jgi:hypothetical protein